MEHLVRMACRLGLYVITRRFREMEAPIDNDFLDTVRPLSPLSAPPSTLSSSIPDMQLEDADQQQRPPPPLPGRFFFQRIFYVFRPRRLFRHPPSHPSARTCFNESVCVPRISF